MYEVEVERHCLGYDYRYSREKRPLACFQRYLGLGTLPFTYCVAVGGGLAAHGGPGGSLGPLVVADLSP